MGLEKWLTNADNILYSFVVPIMSYIVEVRLQLDESHTQRFTTAILATHGLASLISAPVIAHFADKTSNRRIPLLVSLVGCIIGTILVSLTLSGTYYSLLPHFHHQSFKD